MATQLQKWSPKSLSEKAPKSTTKAYCIVGAHHSTYHNTEQHFYLVEEPPQKRLISYAPFDADRGDDRRKGRIIRLPLPWVYRSIVLRFDPYDKYNALNYLNTTRVHFATKRAVDLQSTTSAPLLPNIPGSRCHPCTPALNPVKYETAIEAVEACLNTFWSAEFNEDGGYWRETTRDKPAFLTPLYNLLVKRGILKGVDIEAEEDDDYYDDDAYSCESSTLDFLKAWSKLEVKDVLGLNVKPQFLIKDLVSISVPSKDLDDFATNFKTKYTYGKILRDE